MGNPDIALRQQPDLGSTELTRIPKDTQLSVTCYATGTPVSPGWDGATAPNNFWDKLSYAGQTGYVTDAWLDTGGPIDHQTDACPSSGQPKAPAAPSASNPPPGCGPQHHNGPYSAAACNTVGTITYDNTTTGKFLQPDAYITTPARSSCQITFSMFHNAGSDYTYSIYNSPAGDALTDTQPCQAGTNVHYVPNLQGIEVGTLDNNDTRLVVDVIDHGVTKVIADSPVQSADGIINPASPATGNDAAASTGPGDGKASATPVFCHAPLPFDSGINTTVDVSEEAHLNGDGTVASVDNPSVQIGGVSILASIRDSQSSAIIANGGHSLELHTHATVLYGIGVSKVQVNAPIGVDCVSYYTF